MNKLTAFLCCLLLLPLTVPSYAENIPSDRQIIKKIDIIGNRVKDSVIRKELAFKVGDVLDEEKIEKSKANFFDLGLFKSLDIRQERDESLEGIKVTVEAKDGWYILPWPFYSRRAGTSYAGGMILEQNLFKYAERSFLFGMYGEDMSITQAGLILSKTSFRVGTVGRSFTEYLYDDGAYNSKIFEGSDAGEVNDYGQVVNSYYNESRYLKLSADRSISDKLKASISTMFSDTKYTKPLVSVPAEPERINSLQVGLSYGENNNRIDYLSNFGRVFGLGMADLEHKLKPVLQRSINTGLGITYETSSEKFGSDLEYNKVSLSASWAETFRNESKLALGIKTGIGFDLPFSQLYATDRSEGMLGVYAREFRGDKIALGNLSYRYIFSKTRRGILRGRLFGDHAVAWFEGMPKTKRGVGFDLFYQFWRFPLPLGFGYTYSPEDEDWQASFSIGGMF